MIHVRRSVFVDVECGNPIISRSGPPFISAPETSFRSRLEYASRCAFAPSPDLGYQAPSESRPGQLHYRPEHRTPIGLPDRSAFPPGCRVALDVWASNELLNDLLPQL